MTLTQAAAFVGVAPKTLRRMAENQEISGSHPLHDGPWIFNRADLETAEAKLLVDRVKSRAGKGAGPNADELSLDL